MSEDSKPTISDTEYGYRGLIDIFIRKDIDHKDWIVKKLDKQRGGISFMTPNVDGEIYLTWGDIYYVDIVFLNQGNYNFKSQVSVPDLENIIVKVEQMRKDFVKQTAEVIKQAFSEEE